MRTFHILYWDMDRVVKERVVRAKNIEEAVVNIKAEIKKEYPGQLFGYQCYSFPLDEGYFTT